MKYLACLLFFFALVAPLAAQEGPALPPGDELLPEWQRAHYPPAERAQLWKLMEEIRGARENLATAEARLLAFLKAHAAPVAPDPDPDPDPEQPVDPDPDPDPDPPVDPDPDPTVDPGTEFVAWDELPFDVPRPPAYAVPTLADCDWIIEENGTAKSTRGLSLTTIDLDPINDCYRASVAAGHELPITVGVRGDGGRVWPGGLYSPTNSYSLTIQEPDGWHAVRLAIVGLDDSCEIELGWSKRWGHAEWLGVFNIGIRAPNDSFVMRVNDGIGTYIQDGCWWLPNMRDVLDESGVKIGETPALHASGLHIDKWETLVLRRQRYRGVLPTDPGTLLREHSFYLKACAGDPAKGGGTWILENDLRGGDRTGFQIRPDKRDNAVPTGPVVIADNYADGFGWDHGSNAPGGGGGLVTVWMNPTSPTFIFGNEFTDARYACLVLSGQAPDRNYLNANGFPIESVYVYGNTFRNERASRPCASISAVENVHLWWNYLAGPLNGDLVLDSPWNHGVSRIDNGNVFIYGAEWLDELLQMRVNTWNRNDPGRAMGMPDAQLRGYLVP